MKNLRFIRFWLLLTMGLATVVFNSCKEDKEEDSKQEQNNPNDPNNPDIPYELLHDEGVVINGIKWATRNVNKPGTFTATPQDPGMFYQWNRLTGWAATGKIVGWDRLGATGNTWEKANDPCPTGWRVPTDEEQRSLVNAGSQWVTTPTKGRIFGSDNSTIFLPAAGWRHTEGGDLSSVGLGGSYWSSSPFSIYALYLDFDKNYAAASQDYYRANGYSVRCVCEAD